jgi:hypothetical protein
MRVVAPCAGELEVLLEELVVTAGLAGFERQLTRLLEDPPVARPIVALDLMRRGRRPPEEVRRAGRASLGHQCRPRHAPEPGNPGLAGPNVDGPPTGDTSRRQPLQVVGEAQRQGNDHHGRRAEPGRREH